MADVMECPQEWVAGFCFNGDKVALIRKARPEWQRGKLNGVGGKVEPGETPEYAMHREWVEETGTESPSDWREFCTYDWKGGRVHFMVAFTEGLYQFKTDTDEPVCWRNVDAMLWPEQTIIPNLRWLLPLALDQDATTVHAQEPDAWNRRAHPSAERVRALEDVKSLSASALLAIETVSKILGRRGHDADGEGGPCELDCLACAGQVLQGVAEEIAALRATPAEPSQEAERVRAKLDAMQKAVDIAAPALESAVRWNRNAPDGDSEDARALERLAQFATDGGKGGEG